MWSALHPAAQNLIVAARSLGLGTTFTTFHMLIESELRELLGIPNEVRFGEMIPIGWPRDEFVKVKRNPSQKSFVGRDWSNSLAVGEPVQKPRNFVASVRKKWCWYGLTRNAHSRDWVPLWPDFVVCIDRVLEVLGRETREPGLRRHPAGDRFRKSERA